MHVPDDVRDAARAVFRTHVPGRPLLELVDGGDADAEGRARTLCFTDGDISVEVDVVPGEDGLVHLVVHACPELPVEVRVEHPDPTLSLVARGPSPLKLAAVPGGLTRLVVTSTEPVVRQWHTVWVRL